MTSFARVFEQLIERLVDFFDLLDLSFFLSGLVVLGALYVFVLRADALDIAAPLTALLPGGFLGFLALLVTLYVLGIIAFATGRGLRGLVQRMGLGRLDFDALLRDSATHHGLDLAAFLPGLNTSKLEGHDPSTRLYTRLWVELRQRRRLAPSYTLLRRYWVLAAACDGMAVGLLLWFGAGVHWLFTSQAATLATGVWRFLVVVSVLGAAAMLFREASRYVRYQVEELVATVAFERATRDEDPRPGAND